MMRMCPESVKTVESENHSSLFLILPVFTATYVVPIVAKFVYCLSIDSSGLIIERLFTTIRR